jgi:hypothetical protein
MEKKKNGVSVKEIQQFAKRHRIEVFFCLIFIIALFFNPVFIGRYWSILTAAVGAILGVIFATKLNEISYSAFRFVFKQERSIQTVIGVACLIIAIFLPLVIFLIIGLHGGMNLLQGSLNSLHKK